MARIVLVGAGHTHIELARRATDFFPAGHELILISPEPEHPYSGMGPGLLGGTYTPEQILLPAAALVQRAGGLFVQDSVVSHDPEACELRLSTGRTVGYDLVSINVGSEVVDFTDLGPTAGRSVDETRFPVKPISCLIHARAQIERRVRMTAGCRIAVVGGGPSGVELAGNAAFLLHRLGATIGPDTGYSVDLYAAGDSLAGLKGRRLSWVEGCLRRYGVQVHHRVRLTAKQIADGFPDHIVLLATGIRSLSCLKSFNLPLAADGSIRVDAFLRAEGFPRVFAVGDSAWFMPRPQDRVGVYAVRMQRVLAANLLRAAAAEPLLPFTATGPYLGGLNLGFNRGILFRGPWVARGRLAFCIKDVIDRRFMRIYQRPVQ